METCREVWLLVLDDFDMAGGSRDAQESLYAMLDHRIGHYLPTVITGNLTRAELEPAFGSRLLDRIRRAQFAVLEFGFESKRRNLNADYLSRTTAR